MGDVVVPMEAHAALADAGLVVDRPVREIPEDSGAVGEDGNRRLLLRPVPGSPFGNCLAAGGELQGIRQNVCCSAPTRATGSFLKKL